MRILLYRIGGLRDKLTLVTSRKFRIYFDIGRVSQAANLNPGKGANR